MKPVPKEAGNRRSKRESGVTRANENSSEEVGNRRGKKYSSQSGDTNETNSKGNRRQKKQKKSEKEPKVGNNLKSITKSLRW